MGYCCDIMHVEEDGLETIGTNERKCRRTTHTYMYIKRSMDVTSNLQQGQQLVTGHYKTSHSMACGQQ